MSQDSMPMERLMSITKAATYTPYTATFLRKRAQQGTLNAKKIGRDWLITQEELNRFLKSQAARHEQALLDLRASAQDLLLPIGQPIRGGGWVSNLKTNIGI